VDTLSIEGDNLLGKSLLVQSVIVTAW
jgi:hypothetical protein